MSTTAARKFLVQTAIGICIALPACAKADALHVINSLRVKECAGHRGDKQLFKNNSELAIAAIRIKDGLTLREALKRTDYRADQSSVIHMSGAINEESLKRMLLGNYCATLTDPHLIDVGIFSSSQEIAIVLAAPFSPPARNDASKVAAEVLQLVNEARSKSRRCGTKQFHSALPLELDKRLLQAATAHAKDMAARGHMSHEGSDGSLPNDRITRTGYPWKSVGENVAAGQLSAKEVVSGWLASPGHCANIMDPNFTQMAVAYVTNSKQEIGIYWAQEFGQPRKLK